MSFGNSPIHVACTKNDEDSVQNLIEKGAVINAKGFKKHY